MHKCLSCDHFLTAETICDEIWTSVSWKNDVAMATGGYTGAPDRNWATTGGERTAQGKIPAARMVNAAAAASGEATLAAAPTVPNSFSPAEYSDSETVTGPAPRGVFCLPVAVHPRLSFRIPSSRA